MFILRDGQGDATADERIENNAALRTYSTDTGSALQNVAEEQREPGLLTFMSRRLTALVT